MDTQLFFDTEPVDQAIPPHAVVMHDPYQRPKPFAISLLPNRSPANFAKAVKFFDTSIRLPHRIARCFGGSMSADRAMTDAA